MTISQFFSCNCQLLAILILASPSSVKGFYALIIKFHLRDANEFCWSMRSWNGELELAVGHRGPCCNTALVIDVCVHLQTTMNIVGKVSPNLSHKLNASRQGQSKFPLWCSH